MLIPKDKLISKYQARINLSQSQFPGRDYSKIMPWLLSTSFFDEPASRAYHNNFPGGLAQHVLNYTNALETLITTFQGRVKFSEDQFDPFIVAIGHDLNKVGFYQIQFSNRKINDKWQEVASYTYGDNHPLPSNILSLQLMCKYFELSAAEEQAIYWSEGSWSTHNDKTLDSCWKKAIEHDSRVYFAHTADMIASQMQEEVLFELDLHNAISEWYKDVSK